MTDSFNPAVVITDASGSNWGFGTNSAIPLHVTGSVSSDANLRSEQAIGAPPPSYALLAAGTYYAGANPGDARYHIPMRVTEAGELAVRMSPYYETQFGHIRTASPWTQFDGVSLYELDPREFGTLTGSGGTVSFSTTTGATSLNTTTTSGSTAKIRTHTSFRYQAGREHVVQMTARVSEKVTNSVKRWGLFDDSNGVFWEINGQSVNLVRRTSTSGIVVDNVISQSSWNFDRMDGLGLSTFNLDVTKMNIYETHFTWLGVGNVQCFINGNLCHTFPNQNSFTVPYVRTLNLPATVENINLLAASTGSSVDYVCTNVSSEGGEFPPEYSFSSFNASDITVTTTERPVLSVRLSSSYLDQNNKMLLMPKLVIVSTEGARAGYRVVLNGTLTGASWTPVSAYSGAEQDFSSTALSGGETILRGFLPNSNEAKEIDISMFFGLKSRKLRRAAFTGVSDIITVMMVNEAAGSTLARASLSWAEVR